MTDPTKEFLQKLLAIFRDEAKDHLQEIASGTVALEQDDGAAQGELVQRNLKALHTLKGAARAVDLVELERLCHAMEGVFSALDKSGRRLAPEQFDVLHQAVALARELADAPSGRTRNLAHALVLRLDQLGERILAGQPDRSAPLPQPAAAPAPEPALPDSAADSVRTLPASDLIRVEGKHLDAIRYQVEALLATELSLQHHVAALRALAEGMAEQRKRLRLAEPAAQASAPRGGTLSARQSRGQAVLGDLHASWRGLAAGARDNSMESQCVCLAEAIGKTSREFAATRARLMEAALETALVPFASALNELPSLVRNLARSHGKQAVLKIEGEGIQVDRRILGVIREALIHLVTNAVDHGIEPVALRLAAGKPESAHLLVTVSQRGSGRVRVRVADDGAGIDVAALVETVTAGGQLDADQMAGLNERQKVQLALRAGVSTRAQVSAVSGRGMGLAIVADKVAAVGGELSIENRAGAGCTFDLLLPVRLATLRALVVAIAGKRYALPLAGMEAVQALRSGDIVTVENRETVLAGQRVLPLIRLARLLGVQGSAPSQPGQDGIALIARAGEQCFAMQVDEIVCEQDVLPKSLGKQLRRVRFIAGATQLGDASLVPILTLDDIARHGLAAGDGGTRAGAAADALQAIRRVLVVEDSITSRMLLKHILEGAGYHVDTAVDGLDALSRLRHEDFDALVSDIEMPNMDGLMLTATIRANPQTEKLPVILVTSLQEQEEKERGLRAGADAYVVKGAFDQDNLLATLRRLI